MSKHLCVQPYVRTCVHGFSQISLKKIISISPYINDFKELAAE